ncbi:gamma-glutamyl-gamma-aminobutyrate hydrolase family protein [Saccharothrix sp. 6-C]|uniref:GMP synthase (Glutamine-hydrolysing) n=1 Tax=Saccharothrix texasensis TaxID=103734 RepID=A0A3N1H209_9PSEU|nr:MULTISPECIES: gamma-glutamyl-gamma-aminobutyrate hydrolase family protein [Saccharothrix]QQQ78734.1 gamma-glutamyl-gamma-aminobutyrate hydrolase family protein [Saccharothrix sp. 6-C]ROP36575.1 GMP synthase (glutamine-hydrolysing) [Saccharothrix texasensis]
MSSPRVLVVDNGSLSIDAVQKTFHALGVDSDVTKATEVPSALDGRYQGLVLSGTKVRAYDSEYYKPLIDLVFSTSVPVWGICGGMQIIATAAGAELKPGKSRAGTHEAQVDQTEPVFAEVKPTVRVFQRHTLYVQAAPAGFTTIGWSDDAPVEFLRSDDGRIYGSQAHLEFRNDGRNILRGFVQLFN